MAQTHRRVKAKRELVIASLILLLVSVVFAVTDMRIHAGTGKEIVSVGLNGNADDAIWKAVQAELDRRGDNLTVTFKVFQHGRYANQSLNNREIDLNAFQHYAFLQQEEAQNGYHFSVVADTYISPLNIYSRRYHTLEEIHRGDRLVVPNDTMDLGRSLKVLAAAGLIELKDPKATTPELEDISSNPKDLHFDQVDPANIINMLPDYAAGITNTNFVIDAGMKVTDAIYQVPGDLTSPANHPYVNVIVARAGEEKDPRFRKLVAAYHSPAVAQTITKVYKGAAVPAFTY